MRILLSSTTLFLFLFLAAGCDRLVDLATPDNATPRTPGAVYTLSNADGANEVIVFSRAADGRITAHDAFATGGAGTGDGLNGTSNPLMLSHNGRYLFAVNGGSDQVSALRVDGASLTFLGTVPSGGVRPVSLTVEKDLLYVLNAGANGTPGNISGFRIGQGGALTSIPGSTRPLNAAADLPTQIGFSPDGRFLVVTDRVAITTYAVGRDGLPGAPNVQPSVGQTPFGFAFASRDVLLVSEAFGGQPDASATTSYRIGANGALTVISPSVGTTETAACWIEATPNGRFAYTTNTASSSVTGYHVAADGSLTLLDADGVTASTGEGSSPLDMAIAQNRYLYVHSGRTNEVRGFRIGDDGSLHPVSGAGTGLPPTAVGVAAR